MGCGEHQSDILESKIFCDRAVSDRLQLRRYRLRMKCAMVIYGLDAAASFVNK